MVSLHFTLLTHRDAQRMASRGIIPGPHAAALWGCVTAPATQRRHWRPPSWMRWTTSRRLQGLQGIATLANAMVGRDPWPRAAPSDCRLRGLDQLAEANRA